MIKNIILTTMYESGRIVYRPYIYFLIALFLNQIGLYVSISLGGSPFDQDIGVHQIYENMFIYIIFFAPLFPVGSFSDERSYGVYQLIFSSPISIMEFVIGKFNAYFTIYKVVMFGSLLYAVVIYFLSENGIQWGRLFTSLIGNICIGTYVIAVSLFFSIIFENIMIALSSTYFTVIISFTLDSIVKYYIKDSGIYNIISELLPMSHYRNFSSGFIGLSDLLYFVFCVVFLMILSAKILEIRTLRQ